ncbi:hypothetical protein GW17_00028388 [Ensete ventricosum]|nr:hypothetical protein GW17_00028388 [Ensete ventricosum]
MLFRPRSPREGLTSIKESILFGPLFGRSNSSKKQESARVRAMDDGDDPFASGAVDLDMALDLDHSRGPGQRPARPARFQPKIKGKIKAEPSADPELPRRPPPAPDPVKKQEAEGDPSTCSVSSAPDVDAVATEAMHVDEAEKEEEEEEDSVVREIGVFFTPAPLDEDTSVRVKPKESKMEVDLTIDVDSENYDQDAAEPLRLQKQRRDRNSAPWSIRTFSLTWKGYARKRLKCAISSARYKGSFEAHASYLRDAFDGVTKVIQLVEAKLGLGCLSTGREDAEASTLEEYATVLAIRVVRNKWCIVEIVLVGDRGPGSRQWCTNSIEVVERGEEATTSPVGLSYPKAKCRLERRWTRRSTTVPQRRIYRSRRKGCRCKSTDSRAMGLAAPWYHRGGTSVESSIPCSHGGRALVVKWGRGGE